MKKDNDEYLYQANADSTDSIIVLIDKNNETYQSPVSTSRRQPYTEILVWKLERELP